MSGRKGSGQSLFALETIPFSVGGEHTRARTVTQSKVGGLVAFTKKKESCLGCKTVLNKDGAVCEHCDSNKGEIYQREVSRLTRNKTEIRKLYMRLCWAYSSINA